MAHPDPMPSRSEPALRLDHVSVCYKRPTPGRPNAVEGVSLLVQPGETLAILGPNGSGKSTLLNAIGGYLDVEVDGQVEVLGTPILPLPRHRRASFLALVQQDPEKGTAAHLTVAEHARLYAAQGTRLAASWARLQEILRTTGTTLHKDQMAGELSGGQRQLLALSLALLRNPPLLLMDEPTSALDPQHTSLVHQVLKEHRGASALLATVIVTHRIEEACLLANKYAVFDSGGHLHLLMENSGDVEVDRKGIAEALLGAASLSWQ